ncbi:MAG: DUF1934 domain-containing protein [Clostridia bacterium]|nr:DUF1934 domain-containing protein [Clostridia bacterium]
MKDVIISLKGYSDHEQKLEFVTEGKYYKKGNQYFITYNESEMTGMDGTTTTLKVSDQVVSLIRFGAVNSNFVFQEGKVNTSRYITEFGEFSVEIKANRVFVEMNDFGGVIEMDYLLDLSDGNDTENKFYMTIKEAGNNEYNQ